MKNNAYFNGTFGDFDTMTVPMSERSIYFGDAVYDAILVLDRKPFTLDMHLDRLYRSCELTSISFNMDREALKTEIDKLLSMADMGTTMLYIQVSRGNAPRKHEFPESVKPNLLMFVKSCPLPAKDKRASLLSMEDMRFKYCNIKTVNLLPNVFAAQKATEEGYTEALMHRGERVTEAAHSSILIIKNGKVIMPPLDELILPGITRAIIKELCDKNGILTEQRVFTVNEVLDADEILLCSTTKNVILVYDIDGKAVGGKDRATANKIQELFLKKIYDETGVIL
ncbi:MAG: D-amino acid aminotransferase [Ruminococcaceae bacterium]|nr:D-amino acid aminotransferase [Oscillospiraceae bacterium]